MRRHHGRAVSPYAGRVAVPLSAEVILVRSFDSQINPSRPVRQSPLATSQFQGMPLDLIDRIRSFPLFQSASDAFLTDIALSLKPQMSSSNDYILTEGDDAKSMYWLVRGAVAVTSRDGESTYAELKPGAFFGEIGILMDRPRTATVISRTRCLLLVLKKEDLRKVLPKYPEVERAIRDEALERLTILERKKRQSRLASQPRDMPVQERRGSKRARDVFAEETDISNADIEMNGSTKRHKSPSPGTVEVPSSSALGHGLVYVRSLLKEMPLFKDLPPDILHYLGLNAQPRSFAPFTDIIKQDSSGRELFFVVKGEVEVLDEKHPTSPKFRKSNRQHHSVKAPFLRARLRAGQYFGEVVSLSLAARRTATVRSVTQVECLAISEDVLEEFWKISPSYVKQQVEHTARERLQSQSDNDVVMNDADSAPDLDVLAIGETPLKKASKSIQAPRVTFNQISNPHGLTKVDDSRILEHSDPDPYSSAGLDKVRTRRRGSLAPPPPDELADPHRRRRSPRVSPTTSTCSSPRSSYSGTPSPRTEHGAFSFPFSEAFALKDPPISKHRPSDAFNRGIIPDSILSTIFNYNDLHDLMRFQAVSLHWRNILTKSPEILKVLDLSRYNRRITDEAIIKYISPFVGHRPQEIDISNCFHVTDEGFINLVKNCGINATVFRMKSVWEVTAPAILEMSNRAPQLREVDLSNCRKVSDTLLARIIGWVVPSHNHSHNQNNTKRLTNGTSQRAQRPSPLNTKLPSSTTANGVGVPIPGTVFGCPQLSHLSLSYCKHVTDRTMHHIALHASSRIQSMDLTRCTTITDVGFQYWGNAQFINLRKLCLADCTYLSDQSIVWLVNGAGNHLRELDLSFCCALSDTATEVLALGCPKLENLNLSFCGSAVSDASLRSLGHHLVELRELAVRGCVRVTGIGVESVLEGCARLSVLDVSQCKNLAGWLEEGGVERWSGVREVRFELMK